MKQLPGRNKELTPRMLQVVELVFSPEKLTHEEIGNRLGLSRGRVSTILRCKRVLNAYPIIARRYKSSLIPAAMEAQREVINQSRDLSVKDRASARLLESEGVLERNSTVTVNVFSQMPSKDLIERVCVDTKLPENVIEGELVEPSDDETLPK